MDEEKRINMDFRDKIIVVSGAASGIGKSCADLLIENGAYVIGLDIGQSAIHKERYCHYTIDIREEQKVIMILDEIEELHGKIDGLVNCAGVFANVKPFYELSLADWNRVLSINLTGLFILSKYTAKKMIKNNFGSIVNISCIRSKIFGVNMAEYAASKGGVAALTSAMALDLTRHNIRVNSVAPGFTNTGMTANSFGDPKVRALSERMIPIGKIAEPLDIAKVVLFLLSEMASYINGETIFVDGGFTKLK